MSTTRPAKSVLDHFSALKDPRQSWRVIYPLREILLLALCASLCGMEDLVEIRMWGELRLNLLRRFYPYERGLPAYDTLNDGLNALDPDLFQACFSGWVESLRESEPDIVAIAGKTTSGRPGPPFSRALSSRSAAIIRRSFCSLLEKLQHQALGLGAKARRRPVAARFPHRVRNPPIRESLPAL